MWKSIRLITQPYDKFSFMAILAIIALEVILIITSKLPPEVPLWYSKPWSLSRLSHPLWLYLIPFSSFLILIGNNFLANLTNRLEKLLPKIVSLAGLITISLGFISLIQILSIVRS